MSITTRPTLSAPDALRCDRCQRVRQSALLRCGHCGRRVCEHAARKSRWGFTLCPACLDEEVTADAVRAALEARKRQGQGSETPRTLDLQLARECLLDGIHGAGFCGGRLRTITPHGHGLCERHQEALVRLGTLPLAHGWAVSCVRGEE